jgi:hypothetical protein
MLFNEDALNLTKLCVYSIYSFNQPLKTLIQIMAGNQIRWIITITQKVKKTRTARFDRSEKIE